MKVLNPVLFACLAAGIILFMAGCGTPSKTAGVYGDNSGELPATDNSSESLNGPGSPGTGIEQNIRPAGVDPEADVDYQTLAAQTVYFAFDSSIIRPSERSKLDQISSYMSSNPSKKLMIAGHTDLTGTAQYNRGLGDRRALAVRAYLIGLGVPASQLFEISYGMDKPASPGHTEEDGTRNRRAVPGIITK